MSYPNALVSMCLPYEHIISQKYAEEMRRMTINGARNEFEWGVWCDQDQLYYSVYEIVPGLEETHDGKFGEDDGHNQFTQWLNALFEVQAARQGFDGEV